MCTYYVLYNPAARVFAQAGRYGGFTISLNYAKHFTSEWSANNWKNGRPDLEPFIVKKIQRY